ncbi:MAG: tRNA uridine-5-carboxymethylaminomethyl(34) synthesis GTPase MnmE [Treponema sp.]|nr:tRNA uridine-5-carboxymethylaminomethyl(34) synthesis GTPase MnmE [Treponema sp.]
MYGDDSPIAAFATNPGSGALTVIRCSGKGSIDLLSSVFSAERLKSAAGNTVVHGWIISAGERIDETLVSVFRAPKSYTGEDSLDICCHGGSSAGKAVLSVLKKAGFRDALPGEFTFRAFMNGKFDLTKCESVMELVCAKTDTGRRHAVSRLMGSLENEINGIKQILVQVLAGAEIYLDYSEDEISADAEEAAGKLPSREQAEEAFIRLKKLSGSWQIERIYQEGITLVIAGPPNAGKSSLFNLFLKEDRSIVTEIPGTTRDWIEAFTSIEGIPVRLIDTAGLRNADDSIEKIGIERSRMLLYEADIVLFLFDGALGITKDDIAECETLIKNKRTVFLWNKSDISPPVHPFPLAGISPISISVKTGVGMDELYSAITLILPKENESIDAAIGTERQKRLVDEACLTLGEALKLTDEEEPLDLITPLIRQAVNSLGEITGEVSTADILDEMFSKFCVGK